MYTISPVPASYWHSLRHMDSSTRPQWFPWHWRRARPVACPLQAANAYSPTPVSAQSPSSAQRQTEASRASQWPVVALQVRVMVTPFMQFIGADSPPAGRRFQMISYSSRDAQKQVSLIGSLKCPSRPQRYSITPSSQGMVSEVPNAASRPFQLHLQVSCSGSSHSPHSEQTRLR